VQKRLRYADLLALGIVNNRVTLANWIRDRGFPRGQLTGPNSRTYGEAEVQAWLASRPTAPKPAQAPPCAKSRGPPAQGQGRRLQPGGAVIHGPQKNEPPRWRRGGSAGHSFWQEQARHQ
jgi:predicted DNA-binding transcriptional regulator AlpA